MTTRFTLSNEAAADAESIWGYYRKEHSAQLANRMLAEIYDACVRQSASSIDLGHVRDDLTGAKVRFLTVRSHHIIYRPNSEPLQVVAILHGNRDVSRLLEDRLR